MPPANPFCDSPSRDPAGTLEPPSRFGATPALSPASATAPDPAHAPASAVHAFGDAIGADGGSDRGDGGPLPVPDTALDFWARAFDAHLAARHLGVSASGEAFPQTTAGDVQRAALRFSRELCRSRYDLANLTETRAAWRAAVARAQTLCRPLSWRDPYPENERFWLSDTLALAQRLAAVDVRRNAFSLDDENGLAGFDGDLSDPAALWADLRHFFLGRRVNRRGANAVRYPETTHRDVANVWRIFGSSIASLMPLVRQVPALRAPYRRVANLWAADAKHIAKLSLQPHEGVEVYPDNERFWLVQTRRWAAQAAVLRDLARAGAQPSAEGMPS